MNIKLFKKTPQKTKKTPKTRLQGCCVLCECKVSHFPRVGPGGVTLFDKSVLSVLIVFLLGRYEVSCSPSSPLRNLFLESLLCMFSVWKREREKALVKGIFWKTKKFSPFLWAKERTSFLTRKSKENVKTPIPVMDGKAQAITDNIPDTVHIDDIVKMHTNAHKH